MGCSDQKKPAFLITIDTEGDNLWELKDRIETRNAKYIERFQRLSERYGLKVTYLTNWEMVHAEPFVELARDSLRRGAAEVGMHLHAWNSPPIKPITENDYAYLPYLIEYPIEIISEKVNVLTQVLEDIFAVKMRSHRAGRWAFNEIYAQILVSHGYWVDCSVTPGVSWNGSRGAPFGNGGSDYTRFPTGPYFIDLSRIDRPGSSSLLELPVTIQPRSYSKLIEEFKRLGSSVPILQRVQRYLWPSHLWLRPDGRNLSQMLEILNRAVADGLPYVEFMLHSSEFMPGGSPRFRTEESIERLYRDLESLFSAAEGRFLGQTLSEYYQSYSGV